MTNLLLSNAGTTVLSIFLAILILLAMITIHEFGHYLTGRLLGFKINEFAIGFGPAIFKRVNKKSGVLFSIRAFPLGGFCAFAGEDGEKEQDKRTEVFDDDKIKPVTESASGNKADGAAVKDKSEGKEIKAITGDKCEGKEIKAVTEDKGAQAIKPSGKDFTDQPPWKRIIVLVSGALMNYFLALILIVVCFSAFGMPSYKLLSVAPSEDISAQYCLQSGDAILTANGKTVYLATDLIAALNGKSEGDTVGFTVLRNGREESVNVVLRADCDFKNSSEVGKIWRALGAGTREQDGGLYWDVSAENIRLGFWRTLGRSFGYSFAMAGSIFKVLGELLTGHLGLNAMGGPVTTIKVTGQMAVQGGQSFLQIAAYIGVNLAVFNLLPIPALDGSKVIFCLIEWIFRKPVPRKVEAVIHAAGFILILGFAVLVDILQFARC